MLKRYYHHRELKIVTENDMRDPLLRQKYAENFYDMARANLPKETFIKGVEDAETAAFVDHDSQTLGTHMESLG